MQSLDGRFASISALIVEHPCIGRPMAGRVHTSLRSAHLLIRTSPRHPCPCSKSQNTLGCSFQRESNIFGAQLSAAIKVRFPPTTVLGCDLFVLLNRLAIPAPINRRRHTPQCLAVRFCGRRRRKPGAVAARCPPFDRAALTAVWRQPDPVRLEPVDTAFASRDARPVPIVISNSSSGTAAVDRLHF